MKKLLSLAGLLALGAYLTRDRGKIAVGRTRGRISALRPKTYDDTTLKAKVESELFRDEHEVKGSVSVNAQEGVVQLRGELPSRDLIETLVERTRRIHGVREVENLLHVPGAEAPMHQ